MKLYYSYTVSTESGARLKAFSNFVYLWMHVADIVTKGRRKHWKLKTYGNDIEITFKKERHRDHFGEYHDDILAAIREKNREALRKLLPSKTNSRP